MVEFPKLDERAELTEEDLIKRIADIDALTPSPSDRASRVLKVLQTSPEQFDVWDIVCFCAEFLGSQVENLEFLRPEITRVAGLVNFVHYRQPEVVTNSVPFGESDGSRTS